MFVNPSNCGLGRSLWLVHLGLVGFSHCEVSSFDSKSSLHTSSSSHPHHPLLSAASSSVHHSRSPALISANCYVTILSCFISVLILFFQTAWFQHLRHLAPLRPLVWSVPSYVIFHIIFMNRKLSRPLRTTPAVTEKYVKPNVLCSSLRLISSSTSFLRLVFWGISNVVLSRHIIRRVSKKML